MWLRRKPEKPSKFWQVVTKRTGSAATNPIIFYLNANSNAIARF